MLDVFCLFSDAQSLIGNATTTVLSTSSFDTRAAGTPTARGPSGTIGGPLLHDFGRGRRLKFLAQIVTTVLAAGGAAEIECDFVCCPDDATGQPNTGAITVLLKSAAIAKATLVAGYRFKHGTTPSNIPQRHIMCQYVLTTNNITAGKATAGLVADTEDHADVFG